MCWRTRYPIYTDRQLAIAPPPAPALSFPEFAARQVHACHSGKFDTAAAYWYEHWQRFGNSRISIDDFPMTLPYTPLSESHFDAQYTMLPTSITNSLSILAQHYRVTLHTIFLAAFAILVKHYTRRSSLGILIHLPNRAERGAMEAVGCFSNTHLIGLNLDASQSGEILLNHVQRAVLRGLDHQAMPLQYLWQITSWRPRFKGSGILLDFVKYGPIENSRISSTDVGIERVPLRDHSSPRLPGLGFYIEQRGNEVTVSIRYQKARFYSYSIAQMLRDFQVILASLIAAPHALLEDLADLA